MLENAPPQVRELLKNLPPGSLNQVLKENQPKGKLTFEVKPSSSALGIKALGAPIDLAPLSDAMRGGTVTPLKPVFAVKTRLVNTCMCLTWIRTASGIYLV